MFEHYLELFVVLRLWIHDYSLNKNQKKHCVLQCLAVTVQCSDKKHYK